MYLNATIYNLQVLIGIITFLFALKKAPETVRIDINRVIRFGIACLFIFLIKAFYYAQIGKESYLDTVYLNGINSLAAVWWEDACFVLPYLLAYHFFGKKSFILFPVFVFTTFVFMQGHSYQGPAGMLTFIFPFTSFYYGRKYGAGTMMLCHIIYDISIVVCLSGLRHLIAGII